MTQLVSSIPRGKVSDATDIEDAEVKAEKLVNKLSKTVNELIEARNTVQENLQKEFGNKSSQIKSGDLDISQAIALKQTVDTIVEQDCFKKSHTIANETETAEFTEEEYALLQQLFNTFACVQVNNPNSIKTYYRVKKTLNDEPVIDNGFEVQD